jgi:hypothetical protein
MTRSEPAGRVRPAPVPQDAAGIVDLLTPARGVTAVDPVDALVEQIIAEEYDELRQAFAEGAEFAVTHMETPSERMLHRLECASLEPHLDLRARWSAGHRRRLHDDRTYRLPLPALVTRESARGLSGVRSCKVCWPNVHGTEARPLRKLQARGIRSHHIGHVLSTDDGLSLGTIVRSAQQTEADLFGERREVVEIVTTARTMQYSPSDHVFIWDLPTDEEAIRRKTQLFERFGPGFAPTF